MNKPKNEPLTESVFFGSQLRYVSKRRLRKLNARAKRRGSFVDHRVYNDINGGEFYSWLRPLTGHQYRIGHIRRARALGMPAEDIARVVVP